MKKWIIAHIVLLLLFASCGKEQDVTTVMKNTQIDISSFTVYKGSTKGGLEVDFNNLRIADSVKAYFDSLYLPDLYKDYSFQIYGNKLTYVYPSPARNGENIKTVTDYTYRGDTLYALLNSNKLSYVASLIPGGGFSKTQFLGYYRTTQSGVKIFKSDSPLNLTKMLELIGYSDISQMDSPTTQIAWCNVLYIFK